MSWLNVMPWKNIWTKTRSVILLVESQVQLVKSPSSLFDLMPVCPLCAPSATSRISSCRAKITSCRCAVAKQWRKARRTCAKFPNSGHPAVKLGTPKIWIRILSCKLGNFTDLDRIFKCLSISGGWIPWAQKKFGSYLWGNYCSSLICSITAGRQKREELSGFLLGKWWSGFLLHLSRSLDAQSAHCTSGQWASLTDSNPGFKIRIKYQHFQM